MAIIVPGREDWTDGEGKFTLQALTFFEQLTELTNDTSTDVEQAAFVSSFSAQLQQTVKELAGLPEFTIDTTGFTFDSTEITFDKVIA